MPDSVNGGANEHPRGLYTSRVDEKGRLKLPVDFQKFYSASGETHVFVTSFDERIARIYTLAAWKQAEELLKNAGEDAQAAEDLWFTAMDLGADAEMDNQGRLLLSPALRRSLEIEGKPVYLERYKDHVNVFSESVYAERKARAKADREAKLRAIEKRGLQ